jgi:DNA polymerase epsilon subunit 2
MAVTAQRLPEATPANPVPSSSPAFATPVHPIRLGENAPIPPPSLKPATILPVQLQPALLRKTAVRVFKNHDLNIESTALATLATFVGRHCGSGWREDGLAEGVLTEVAKMWKKEAGEAIVKGGDSLKSILKTLEGSMSGGRVTPKSNLSRQTSFALSESNSQGEILPHRPGLSSQNSFGLSSLEVRDEEEEEDILKDPREWIQVVNAFDQPRLVFNPTKKHFEKSSTKPSILPQPSHKTDFFRQRYHLVHQRVLRHESFQSPTFNGNQSGESSLAGSRFNKITPIANLLGRSGSTHLLLGLITVSPTGTLALSDLTGGIALDLQHAKPFPDEDSAWFAPGMVVLVDGVYQEDYSRTAESALGNTGGIGGTIGGKFIGSVVAHPPCERRAASLGIQDTTGVNLLSLTGPAFGWTDFLGVGSERAIGSRMRKLQQQIIGQHAPHAGNAKIAIASDLNLDNPSTLTALRSMLSTYSALPPSEFPMAIVLLGNFLSQAAMAGAPGAGSIDYKEYFNSLASVLSDFPALIARTTFVFAPGDNDVWPSSFSAGSATPLPRKPVPEIFTSRVRRAIAEANREIGGGKERKEGEAVWTTNPSRLTWFGCEGEMVLLRDDMSGRLKRSAIRFAKQEDEQGEDQEMNGANSGAEAASSADEETQHDAMEIEEASATTKDPDLDPDTITARRFTKTILDQAHLAPFPISSRPVHWDYGNVLHLYPLPTALVLADPDAPAFTLNYMGCCVMNPAKIVDGRRGEKARWIEYDVMKRKGEVRIVDSLG